MSLFDRCDYYLDINHESEVASAVKKAFLHNQLILGFKETLHNKAYVADEHVFEVIAAMWKRILGSAFISSSSFSILSEFVQIRASF